MKIYEIQDEFGLDHFVQAQRPAPSCGPGQVRIAMKAAAPNFRDLMMIEGNYNPRQPLPLIPISDGAGEVVEVGEGVERLKVGARVVPCFAQGWQSGEPSREKFKRSLGGPIDGAIAEYMVVDAADAVEFPDYLSFEEAATLPCAALTAWNALAESGSVRAGDVVVCQGTGGVSIFGLQFAKALGAEVIITSSSDEKLATALTLGASHGINYQSEPNWGKAVRELTGGRGADHILEVGGAKTLEQSMAAVRYGGEISVIGVLSGATQKINIVPILMHQLRVQGIYVGNTEMLQNMMRVLQVHQIRPQVDRVFDFEEAPEALRYLKAGKHFGKIVIRIG